MGTLRSYPISTLGLGVWPLRWPLLTYSALDLLGRAITPGNSIACLRSAAVTFVCYAFNLEHGVAVAVA